MREILLPLVRPVLMSFSFVAGWFLPLHGAGWCIRYLLILMLFFVFLRMKFGQLQLNRSHFLLVLLNFLMGVTPFLILKYAGYPELALSAFFVGITPTATAAPVIMGFLGGRVPYVITAFLMTNISISLAMPLLIFWVHGGQMTAEEFLHMTGNIAALILIPVAFAWTVRKLFPEIEKVAKRTGNISFALWIATLYVISSDASVYLHKHAGEGTGRTVLCIAGISFLICVLNFLFGRLVAEKNHRREGSQSLGQKNTTFTIYLACAYGSPLIALGPTFYVLWHNTWNACQMYLHSRSQEKKNKKK